MKILRMLISIIELRRVCLIDINEISTSVGDLRAVVPPAAREALAEPSSVVADAAVGAVHVTLVVLLAVLMRI